MLPVDDADAARAVTVRRLAEFMLEFFDESVSISRPELLATIRLARSAAWVSASTCPIRIVTPE